MVALMLIGIPLVCLILAAALIFGGKAGVRKGGAIFAVVAGLAGLAFGLYSIFEMASSDPAAMQQIRMAGTFDHRYQLMASIIDQARKLMPLGTAICVALLGLGVFGLARPRHAHAESEVSERS